MKSRPDLEGKPWSLEYCNKGNKGCYCAVGWPPNSTCPKCRSRPEDDWDSYCICPPQDIEEVAAKIKALAASKESFEENFEMAPQESLRFCDPEIVDKFMIDVLDAGDAFFTDMSSVRHFEDFDGQKTAWNTKELIIARAQKEFGVDITPMYDADLPILFNFIKIEMGKKKNG